MALSSAEAKLSGICRGASHGLGMVSLAKDIDIDLALEIHSDATAAIANDGECGEAEDSTTFHYLGDAVYLHEFLLQIAALLFVIRHRKTL